MTAICELMDEFSGLRYAVDASKVEREVNWRPAERFETGLRKMVFGLPGLVECDPIRSGNYGGERLGAIRAAARVPAIAGNTVQFPPAADARFDIGVAAPTVELGLFPRSKAQPQGSAIGGR